MTIVLNGTTGITTPGTDSTTLIVNANNISAVNSLGFRNRIINGDMRIDQRNAGAAITVNGGTNQYSVDRFFGFDNSSAVFTLQQSSTAPAGFMNSLLATVTTASGTLTTTQRDVIVQAIEGYNIADLGWGAAGAASVTLSFWVRSSLTGSFGGSLMNSATDRSYPFQYTISAANTWEQKTITIAGDTVGTWLTTNGTGIQIVWSLGVGPSLTGTANAWAAAGYRNSTGSVNLVETNGATFYITGVQLEAGSVASPFERRDYGRELMMCQRYYQTGTISFYGYATNTVNFGTYATFPVQMRTAPTVVGTNISVNGFSATPQLIDNSTSSFVVYHTANATASASFKDSYTSSSEL